MKTNVLCAVILLIGTAGIPSGCSKQPALARHFSKADRVTIVDLSDSTFVVPLSEEETARLLHAISTARKESPLLAASVSLNIKFFKGTNLLWKVDVSETGRPDHLGFFGVHGTPYSDSSGVIEALAKKFWAERAMREATKRIGY